MRKAFLLLPAALLLPIDAAAWIARDAVVAEAAVDHLWDTNFTRTPDGESEQITTTSALLQLTSRLSRQELEVGGRVGRVQYDQRSDMDANIYDLSAAWRGEIGSRTTTEADWTRLAEPADQEDFVGRDVVTQTDLSGRLAYALGLGLFSEVSAGRLEQSHSNPARAYLEFEDYYLGAGLGYRSGRDSVLAVRYRAGERRYANADVAVPFDFDYDYARADLEVSWVVSPNTNLSASIGGFERRGALHDQDGINASASLYWRASAATDLWVGYALDHPAAGERHDQPLREHRVELSANWNWTAKTRFSTGVQVAWQDFEEALFEPAREERRYRLTPVAVRYEAARFLYLTGGMAFQARRSDEGYREYDSTQLHVALALTL